MNPHGQESSGIELPPIVEGLPVIAGSKEAAPKGAEVASGKTERAPASRPGAGQAMTAAPAIPLPLPPMAPTAAPAGAAPAATQGQALLTKDDGDLIEKEWVDKAKQIVERTRDDPFRQSEELTVFKADYMKKRYGKTIKVSQ